MFGSDIDRTTQLISLPQRNLGETTKLILLAVKRKEEA